MDFESAARRLAKDQRKIRSRKTVELSSKARKQAEYSQLQQKKRAEARALEAKRKDHQQAYMRQCDRLVGLSSVSSAPTFLKATSIHGEGDKIALPPSILEHLSAQHDMINGSPWTFRIAICNPSYQFPASEEVKKLEPNLDHDEYSDSEEDEDLPTAAYLSELSHKYLSCTQGSVVEFTQDEGHIGIPASIAAALIKEDMPVMRTKDLASDTNSMDESIDESDSKEPATPGHLAWGAFDLPDLPIEVSLVKLPKGKGCTLVPSLEAVQNGFYNLQDVKLVLEQSLIRTRATLSVGDTVHTWHRGTKFDLTVKDVTPPTFNAVVCVNTDIEVEFGPIEGQPESDAKESTSNDKGRVVERKGRTLVEDTKPAAPKSKGPEKAPWTTELPPEPPVDQKDSVCHVQIRSDGSQGRRKFDTGKTTVHQLFSFAATLTGPDVRFRLVTRFPRRVIDEFQFSLTLEQVGITSSQELFLMERL